MSEACDVNAANSVCAEKIANYMYSVAAGAVSAKFEFTAAITSYLDSLSYGHSAKSSTSAEAVTAFLDDLACGQAAVPSVEAMESYLGDLSTGKAATPATGSNIISYLSRFDPAPIEGAESTPEYSNDPSATAYFDSMPPSDPMNPMGSQDVSREVNQILEACNVAVPTAECASAITKYLETLSTGSSLAGREGSAAITNYLDSISSGDGGMKTSAAAVTSYLDALSCGIVELPSEQAIRLYLDALYSGQLTTPATGGDITSYLSSVNTGSATTSTPSVSSTDRLNFYQDNVAVTNSVDSMPSTWNSDSPATPASKPIVSQGNVSPSMPRVAAPMSNAELELCMETMSEACDVNAANPACAEAISDYLYSLSAGAVQPQFEFSAAISSYLDSLSYGHSATSSTSAEAVTGFLDDLANGQAAAPSVEAIESYLEALSTGQAATPAEGSNIISYLSRFDPVPIQESEPEPTAMFPTDSGTGVGPDSYLDSTSFMDSVGDGTASAVPTTPMGTWPASYDDNTPSGLEQDDSIGGGGRAIYANTLTEACNAKAPSEQCSAAISNYLDALSVGTVEPTRDCADAITNHVDSISTKKAANTSTSAGAITALLDGLSRGTVAKPTEKVVSSYLDVLSSGDAATPATGGAITSYMSSLNAYASVPSGSAITVSGVDQSLERVSDVCGGGASTTECAAAITGYFNSLSKGNSQPTGKGVAAITSCIDSLSDEAPGTISTSAGAVTAYLAALATRAVESPSEKAVASYLDALSSRRVATPATGGAITSYLSTLSTDAPVVPNIVGDSSQYLNILSAVCESDAPIPECATAITNYLVSVSIGAVLPSGDGAAAITAYIDSISPGRSNIATTSASAVTAYLVSLSTKAINAPSEDAICSYLEALSTGQVTIPPTGSAITSYLGNADGAVMPTGYQASASMRSMPSTPSEPFIPPPVPSETDIPPPMPSFNSESSTTISVTAGTSGGKKNYVDMISEACNVHSPSQNCADVVADYLAAISTGEIQPTKEGGNTISRYLDDLSPQSPVESSDSDSPSKSSASAVTSFLGALSIGAVDAPTSNAFSSYLDALQRGEVTIPKNGAAITGYLSSVKDR